MTNEYLDQFERVKRYFSRFKQINDGQEHSQSSQNYDDDIYAFFQNCYHLKDWIKNDPACSSWSDVEDFINQNPDLSICADLCNALKHLKKARGQVLFFAYSIAKQITRLDPLILQMRYEKDDAFL